MVKRLFIFNMRLTIKIRKPAVLAVVAGVATLVGAYEIPVGGDFADTGPDGFPSAWTWHDYSV